MIVFSLEVLSWVFVILLPIILSLRYLIIQRYFLILSLFGIVFLKELLPLCFLLKLGLPPLHLWFIRIARLLRNNVFLFITTIHKLLPIFLMRKMFFSLFSVVRFSLLLGLLGRSLIEASTLLNTLLYSSIVHSVWMVLRVLVRKRFILLYFFIYFLVRGLLLTSIFTSLLRQNYMAYGFVRRVRWLLLSGLPPFTVFWLKVTAVFRILNVIGTLIVFVVVFIRIIAITAYYRSWYFRRILGAFIRKLSLIVYLLPFLLFLGLVY